MVKVLIFYFGICVNFFSLLYISGIFNSFYVNSKLISLNFWLIFLIVCIVKMKILIYSISSKGKKKKEIILKNLIKFYISICFYLFNYICNFFVFIYK